MLVETMAEVAKDRKENAHFSASLQLDDDTLMV